MPLECLIRVFRNCLQFFEVQLFIASLDLYTFLKHSSGPPVGARVADAEPNYSNLGQGDTISRKGRSR